MSIAAAGAALTLTVLTGCGADGGPEERAFGPAGERITISAESGDLDVRPADVDEIEVTRWFTGWSAIGARTGADWEFAGDTLALTTDCAPLLLGRCDVRYEVLVPREVAVTVDGGSGAVSASGFASALDITTDNGAIRVEDAADPLSLRSASGEQRATGVTSGSVEARSENGAIRLSLAEAPDSVEVEADNGAVTVEVPEADYDVTTATDSGDVRTDVPEDSGSPHTITARTGNGAISVLTAVQTADRRPPTADRRPEYPPARRHAVADPHSPHGMDTRS
ncbi:DUF4097 family beta strand repeat-containing protein [Nocardiopsis mangrovi]|uniref:DUF4097 family beta strand repeat-containing protein n=1 Tax=Nocardiopsis mangrovi TaxID=1179818 RepID=A0ABV9E2H9_9ACTN